MIEKGNKNRVVEPKNKEEDKKLDYSLRPQKMADYVGQTKAKENLNILVSAANKRSEPVEHILIHGGPGLGKTTLAHIISNETGTGIKITSGPAIERAGDLAAILTNLEEGDILFIDEIHRINRTVEEVLYPAMEDYCLDIVVGKGPGAKTLRLDLPKFTLIGATTKPSNLSSPLRDRFGANYKLNYYSPEEIRLIVKRSANILNCKIDDTAAQEIANRSRQTPRIANRLLKRVRDYSEVQGSEKISLELTKQALEMLEIDEMGLDLIDRQILETICEKFKGGPVGLNTVCATLGEDIATLEEMYEPFLLQLGFLQRTPRGRIVSDSGYSHIGKIKPVDSLNKKQEKFI